MTRRAARLAYFLILAAVVGAPVVLPWNGELLLAELLLWAAIGGVIGEGRRRFVVRYGYGVTARAQARREWR